MKMNAFQRHVTEMVMSMLVPMGIRAICFFLVFPWLRINVRPGVDSPSGLIALVVALLGMTIPMMALMRMRGHSWRHVWEMTGAMFVPIVFIMPVVRILLPRIGITITSGFMLPLAFVAMTAGMIVLMLLRRDVYSKHPH